MTFVLVIAAYFLAFFCAVRAGLWLTSRYAGRWQRKVVVAAVFALFFAPALVGAGHGISFAPAWLAVAQQISLGQSWGTVLLYGLAPLMVTFAICLGVSYVVQWNPTGNKPSAT
jgi:hypothetical protein